MEHILEDLVECIGREMPVLKAVDEDCGQLEMLDEEGRDTYPLVFPAVLVDAQETQWTNDGQLRQRGTCTVRARLLVDCYDDTHWGSGTTALIREREALRRRLHVLLQGRRVAGGGALMRVQSRFFTARHGIKVYEQTYTAAVEEDIPPALEGAGEVRVRVSAGCLSRKGR